MNPDRRTILKRAALGAGALALPACAVSRRTPRFELVLHGGTLVDGNGTPRRRADVALADGRIAAIGAIDPEQAARCIDARGLVVAPGFVDIHSHSDRSILELPTADSRVLQGYTCEITGNCGGSAAPSAPGSEREFASVRDYLRAVDEARPSIHQVLLVGHGTLRERQVGPVDRLLTEAELARMARELEQALDQGAAGLSSGLEYAPGLWAPPAELVALARVAARAGKLYASHMRSEDARLLEAVAETLELARESGCRVQVSHLKACGRANWPKLGAALAEIERAVREGCDVRADMYPYTAYSTGLTILLPSWARAGGTEALLARLADPVQRARMRAELLERVANEPGGFDLIAIASELEGASRGLTGLSLAAIAARWGVQPVDACLRLLEEQRGSVSYVGHAMQESDVARVLAHPLVLVGSDGSVQPLADESGSKPHPRSFGAAARVLGRFVRELGVLDLASAVQKLAALPAERVHLSERGRVERGFHADLVVFDPERVADLATFENPRRAPAGIEHVLVAGQPVVERGRHTGARPGCVL